MRTYTKSKNNKRESIKYEKIDLSARIAEPSSNNSSTIPIADSFFDSLLEESWDFLLKNHDRNLLCFFLGGEAGCILLSGGIISTTMQVVSSFRPRVLSAS